MKLFLALMTAAFGFTSLQASDAIKFNNGKLVVTTSGSTNKPVYYVDFPASVVSPPNNNAYSGGSVIIKDNLIYLSGVTGQDINGNPIPPTGDFPFFDWQDQITQAYQNLVNILNYLHIPVEDVIKLDVLIEGSHDGAVFEVRRYQCNVAENQFWGASNPKPPRTITGVSALNLGVVEVSAIVYNPYDVVVKKQ